jgi:hypothetical protein
LDDPSQAPFRKSAGTEPEETREYVAKVLAAAIVSMNAQKYGLAGTKEEK